MGAASPDLPKLFQITANIWGGGYARDVDVEKDICSVMLGSPILTKQKSMFTD